MLTRRDDLIKHKIDLKDISEPKEILTYFRKNKIKEHVYVVAHAGAILKFGMSESIGTPGERLYRQLANIPAGWKKPFRSPSGKDFQCVCDDYQARHNLTVDKNRVSVLILDFSNYEFEYENHSLEIRRCEAEFIKEYVDLHGEKPIGNLRDEAANLEIEACTIADFKRIFPDD